MAIVKVTKIGETTVVFHDDYCKNTTSEEVERILKHIAEITLPYVRKAEEKTAKGETG